MNNEKQHSKAFISELAGIIEDDFKKAAEAGRMSESLSVNKNQDLIVDAIIIGYMANNKKDGSVDKSKRYDYAKAIADKPFSTIIEWYKACHKSYLVSELNEQINELMYLQGANDIISFLCACNDYSLLCNK